MFQPQPAFWLAAAATATCAAAMAQSTPQASALAPAAVPAPFRSAFDGYQLFTEEKLAPWKQSNDTVGKVGGWRAYAREAREGADKPPGPTATPAPSGGHKH